MTLFDNTKNVKDQDGKVLPEDFVQLLIDIIRDREGKNGFIGVNVSKINWSIDINGSKKWSIVYGLFTGHIMTGGRFFSNHNLVLSDTELKTLLRDRRLNIVLD
jgi:hypothetical protein